MAKLAGFAKYAAVGLGGGVETVVENTILGKQTTLGEFLSSAVISGVSYGILDNLFRGGKRAANEMSQDKTNQILLREGKNANRVPMDPDQFQRIKTAYEKQGGKIIQDAEAQRLLDYHGADASTMGWDTVLLRPEPTASEVFEEMIHTSQCRRGIMDSTGQATVFCELEAAEKLVRNRSAYRIPDTETIETLTRAQNLINDYHRLGMEDDYLSGLIDQIVEYGKELDVEIFK